MTRNKWNGDGPNLLAEGLAMREAILMVIHKGIQRIIIQSDSQLVANSINIKMEVPKDITNLVEDVKCLLTRLVTIECDIVIGFSIEMPVF